jgi:uncharacterized protein (DUF433 family)
MEADMTIKWVKVDPLVMRGEPFCYNTRLTVRQLLELRRDGYEVARLLREHPELRVVGIAHAYRYAAEHRAEYGEFFDRDGALVGPGLTDDEAAVLPEALRIPGVVVAAPKSTARAKANSPAV